MNKKRTWFGSFISGALAVSATDSNANEVAELQWNGYSLDDSVEVGRLNTELPLYIAAHRSHSSHSSHRSSGGSSSGHGSHSSHGSHRSSSTSGPTYNPPSSSNDPLGKPPTPSSTQLRSSDKASKLINAMNDNEKRKNLIMRIQLTLQSLGYYSGTIDGVLGPGTRKAINSFRIKYGLPTSEKLDVATLDALGILVN